MNQSPSTGTNSGDARVNDPCPIRRRSLSEDHSPPLAQPYGLVRVLDLERGTFDLRYKVRGAVSRRDRIPSGSLSYYPCDFRTDLTLGALAISGLGGNFQPVRQPTDLTGHSFLTDVWPRPKIRGVGLSRRFFDGQHGTD
jgi:hypothetical protein